MKSGKTRKPVATISLYSFLDVMTCTMGAMIVLFYILVQQARVDADTLKRDRAAAAIQPAPNEVGEREDLEWRREVLEKQRGELAQKLAEQRLELGHLEDHIRRLQDEWKRLVAQAEELNRAGKSKQTDGAAIDAERSRLHSEIERTKRELAESKEKLAKQPRSFAIIPYKGPNGTHRRPIYIECRGDAIIFQPEGVVLSPADFEGPLAPGNPFDAALRATREYLADAGANKGGEPYPLLVVRPNGAVAYAVARSAMKSWDDEFGYELVDQEMKLAFPPADPELAAVLTRALQEARRRQEMLARAAPSRFKGMGMRGARGAGSEGISGAGGFGERFGTEMGIGNSPGNSPLATSGTTGGTRPVFGAPGRIESQTDKGTGAGSEQANSGSPASGPRGMFYGSEPPPAKVGAAGAAGVASNTGAAGQSKGSAGETSPQGAPGMPSLSVGKDQGEQQPNAGDSSAKERQARARRRTPNWGLPNSSASAVGYTRPIRVSCSAARLFILPERGAGDAPRVVPLEAGTAAPIDEFVDAIWKHMDRWGIAGQRAYWKPVLSVQVAPGGEERFAELTAQLEGSGLDVKRK